jgi:predicted enzyme related to lactoylglutathione lyase
MSNQIVWCDIPVANLDRAIKFYSGLLGKPVAKEAMPGMTIGLLPHAGEDVGACLCEIPDIKPGLDGPLIYLNCDGRLDIAIATVELNGGEILKPKHQIGPYGWRAVIQDSEGNRIALHSK